MEQELSYRLFFIVANLFNTYVVYKFLGIFFQRDKVSRKLEVIKYFIYFFCNTALYFWKNIPMLLLLFTLSAFFLLTLPYEGSLRKRILSVILLYFILMAIELLGTTFVGIVDFAVTQTNDFSSIRGLFCIRAFSYIAALIAENFQNLKKGRSIPSMQWIVIFLVPAASMVVMLQLANIDSLTYHQVVLSMALLLLINFSVFYLYDMVTNLYHANLDQVLIQQQNAAYQMQFELMQDSQKSIKLLRHDLKSHLHTIQAYLDNNQSKEARSYLMKLTRNMDFSKKGEYVHTGNFIIDSILNFKIGVACQKDIQVLSEIHVPHNLLIDELDMTILLGNLMDNAIRATEHLLKENRKILLSITFDRNRMYINMENEYVGVLQTQDGKLKTTKPNKKNHGLGLESVEYTVAKYDGILRIDTDNQQFQIHIMLFYEGKT